MKRIVLASFSVLILSSVLVSFFNRPRSSGNTSSPIAAPTPKPEDSVQAKIQIVFALDATGSMSGLIGAAKEKIWSIAGSLAQADPSPTIEMGLLFYRDKGDEFVTRMVPLSKDLDLVYADLMQIIAAGGGDSPESVNQALHESVTKFKWDTSENTYRTVFLVGDCPPHMDYRDDVKYPISCKTAKDKDIVLNTILMGNDHRAKQIWREIAICNQGSFTQVNMDANDILVQTPYDSVIAVISDRMDDTRLYYGNMEDKSAAKDKMTKSKTISVGSKVTAKAQRAEYNTTSAGKKGYYGDKELVEGYKTNKLKLENIRKEELPDEMKNMTEEEQKKFIEKRIAQRDSLQKELVKFTKLRQDYISKDLKSRKPGEVDSSFSNQIYKSIRKQTEKKKIYLKAETKY
jgi:hypothetical protein